MGVLGVITPTKLLVAKEVERMIGGSLRELSATEESRRRLLRRLAPVAPPLLAYLTLTRIAGTDSGRYDRFEAALQQYHAGLQELFEPYLMRRSRVSAPLEIPTFTFREHHPAEIVATSLPACGFLFAAGGLITWWSVRHIRI